MRFGKRKSASLREVRITPHFIKNAEGSVLIEMGETRIVCTASVEDGVPPFLRGSGSGWITAEYGMLPRSTEKRMKRESSSGKIGGRTHEIQRLIGRSLRAVVDLSLIPDKTIWLDCDVIHADGGTRCASITGAWIALCFAIEKLLKNGQIEKSPIMDAVAAVSVGVVNGKFLLDLDYSEDAKASVDMNFVMTGSGNFVEIQGTAEKHPFSKKEMDELTKLAEKGIKELVKIQKKTAGLKIG